ncbi:COP9 signalosome subunit 7 (CsnG) [Metarhizium album ARSEF 1941]|uniref:COP9 signalosome subunit 7 (CsnG) n=1 Tax=Metarhizium album (strain ARSEF 1941) TaxID=1081103 RepID=A0A0B2WT99_METAS|nr:COP9 signalosome subunit 7 (CsnG) [Metarhizium album ARSEF 1941]KHN96869.1 COP9 signalosome subunit 7 (CsnG) [Metarhizium album ARSEF 1941]
MEQAKALNALEPFLALSSSATSDRAAADVVMRATSAPNTYIFAELLRQPRIRALAGNLEFSPHLRLLEVFSYGTYQDYRETRGLPRLNEPQMLKLRQLTLLTLARDRSNLSYQALQKALGLTSARQLEDLVITAMYAGLLHATLDPARQAVQVNSLAPLRDLAPRSIQDMIAALGNWSDKCASTLRDLDAQIVNIRAAAVAREKENRAAEQRIHALVSEARDSDKKTDQPGRDALPRRAYNKRSMVDASNITSAETMDVDEPPAAEEQKKRSGKRKM